jgi:broad specificity phosphatase PhoE
VSSLFLVRHGRPLVDHARPAHEWPLDPAYDDDVRALRPRLPSSATWYTSPEPKAFTTARLLTEQPLEVVADLREHERSAGWIEDFDEVVRRAFAHPEHGAYAGWEPLAHCRRRVVGAAVEILAAHPDQDVVLVGHGTAWTLLRSTLLGRPPELAWWSALAMPDLFQYASPDHPGDMLRA